MITYLSQELGGEHIFLDVNHTFKMLKEEKRKFKPTNQSVPPVGSYGASYVPIRFLSVHGNSTALLSPSAKEALFGFVQILRAIIAAL